MTKWFAVAYGALDIAAWEHNRSDAELMVVPVLPSEPLGLAGGPAALWRSLAAGPVADEALTPEQRDLIREFESAGLASRDGAHPARVRELREPWLSSPMHELVYSLIAGLARDSGIEAVFIKGPVLHRQGLRKRSHSGDVDVWLEPERLPDLVQALNAWGWEYEPGLWGMSPAYHSITVVPGGWGCEVDLHRHMPGCAVSDASGFAAVLQHTEEAVFAGISARVPRRAAHAVISALHHMRPEQGHPEEARDTAAAQAVLAAGGEAAVRFADEIRAGVVLEAPLRAAHPEVVFATNYRAPLNWRWRTEPNPLKRHLLALRMAPLSMWPRAILQALWPADSAALIADRVSGGTARTAFQAKTRRLLRGAAWAIRRAR